MEPEYASELARFLARARDGERPIGEVHPTVESDEDHQSFTNQLIDLLITELLSEVSETSLAVKLEMIGNDHPNLALWVEDWINDEPLKTWVKDLIHQKILALQSPV